MYSRELLRLALRLAEQERLADFHGTAESRSRTCGSVIVADVRLDGGRVAAFGQDVRACAVGQGSAAILGYHIIGMTEADISLARDKFAKYLNGLDDNPGSWKELELLAEMRQHKGRHAAALLPYDAALAAIAQAVSLSRNAATSAS